MLLLFNFDIKLEAVRNKLKMIGDNFAPFVLYTFLIAVAIVLCLKLLIFTW